MHHSPLTVYNKKSTKINTKSRRMTEVKWQFLGLNLNWSWSWSSYCSLAHSVLYLGQVEVGLRQQVGMMFGHQADNVIKHPVLLIHGDGEIRLLHCGKQPAQTTELFSGSLCSSNFYKT